MKSPLAYLTLMAVTGGLAFNAYADVAAPSSTPAQGAQTGAPATDPANQGNQTPAATQNQTGNQTPTQNTQHAPAAAQNNEDQYKVSDVTEWKKDIGTWEPALKSSTDADVKKLESDFHNKYKDVKLAQGDQYNKDLKDYHDALQLKYNESLAASRPAPKRQAVKGAPKTAAQVLPSRFKAPPPNANGSNVVVPPPLATGVSERPAGLEAAAIPAGGCNCGAGLSDPPDSGFHDLVREVPAAAAPVAAVPVPVAPPARQPFSSGDNFDLNSILRTLMFGQGLGGIPNYGGQPNFNGQPNYNLGFNRQLPGSFPAPQPGGLNTNGVPYFAQQAMGGNYNFAQPYNYGGSNFVLPANGYANTVPFFAQNSYQPNYFQPAFQNFSSPIYNAAPNYAFGGGLGYSTAFAGSAIAPPYQPYLGGVGTPGTYAGTIGAQTPGTPFIRPFQH